MRTGNCGSTVLAHAGRGGKLWPPCHLLQHVVYQLVGPADVHLPGHGPQVGAGEMAGAMAGGGTGMSEEAVRASSEYTWALQHAEIYTLGWVALILAVFVPLSIRQYQRAVAR